MPTLLMTSTAKQARYLFCGAAARDGEEGVHISFTVAKPRGKEERVNLFLPARMGAQLYRGLKDCMAHLQTCGTETTKAIVRRECEAWA